jgi:hypothetical protein
MILYATFRRGGLLLSKLAGNCRISPAAIAADRRSVRGERESAALVLGHYLLDDKTRAVSAS